MEKGRSRTLNVVPKTLHVRHVLLQDGELSSSRMRKSLSSTQWSSSSLTTIIEGEKSEHKDQDDTLHISQFLVSVCHYIYLILGSVLPYLYPFSGLPCFQRWFIPVVDERQKSKIEKRKRNLKSISPISRGEREICISFPHFREEKEKSEFYFHTFERRKRNMNFISPVSRGEREIWILFPHFREEKEKS